jgi:hypothetical protein
VPLLIDVAIQVVLLVLDGAALATVDAPVVLASVPTVLVDLA